MPAQTRKKSSFMRSSGQWGGIRGGGQHQKLLSKNQRNQAGVSEACFMHFTILKDAKSSETLNLPGIC
jgi:hypothetical protein